MTGPPVSHHVRTVIFQSHTIPARNDRRSPREAVGCGGRIGTAGNVQKHPLVKTRRSPRRTPQACSRPWMYELASVAAEARTDGGAKLHGLLHTAKFDQRPRLSLLKHAA